jgi:undecaprenyl-diphosphatase
MPNNLSHRLNDLDHSLTAQLRLKDESSLLFRIGGLVAHSGDSWLWLVILATSWLLTDGDWHAALTFIILSLIFQSTVVLILKLIFRRHRPEGNWGGIYRVTDPYSFPSGHAARAILIATLSWHLVPGWPAALLTLWALLVCLARILMGVHYLSDVLAGMLAGMLAGWAMILIHPWLVSALPILFYASPKLIFSLYNK